MALHVWNTRRPIQNSAARHLPVKRRLAFQLELLLGQVNLVGRTIVGLPRGPIDPQGRRNNYFRIDFQRLLLKDI